MEKIKNKHGLFDRDEISRAQGLDVAAMKIKSNWYYRICKFFADKLPDHRPWSGIKARLNNGRFRWICVEELGMTYVVGQLDRATGVCTPRQGEPEAEAWFDGRANAKANKIQSTPVGTHCPVV